jgi:hypothetical protein
LRNLFFILAAYLLFAGPHTVLAAKKSVKRSKASEPIAEEVDSGTPTEEAIVPGETPPKAKSVEATEAVDTTTPAKPKVDESKQVGFFLTDPNGNPAVETPLEKDAKGFVDLLFRTKLPKSAKGYSSWGFEASDPEERRYYQMAFEGEVPEIIHWDGVFADESEVKLGRKYFFRLLLVYDDGRIVSSKWGNFSTIKKKGYQGPKNRGEFITLYVMPDGASHFLFLKTKSQTATTFPHIHGDFKIHLLNDYMCGMGFSTTANTLFGVRSDASSFGYSDVSGFCRYRLMGSPIRAPVIPLSPTYMGKDFKPVIPEGTFGAPQNLEVGLKLFYSTLRGTPGSTLHNELFRNALGLAATVNFSQEIWLLRAHMAGEVGYSALKGSLLMLAGELGVTFERLKDISPGVQIKYSLFSGGPPSDQSNAGTSITNGLLFVGVMGYFKL